MPMLERTAATLEPCSLHKVLPSVPTSGRSRRQLHTAFWNHGASSVELFGACQVLVGSAMEESLSTEPAGEIEEKRPDIMTASAFVLDFLYPRGSLSLLRRLNRITLDGYEKPTIRFNNPVSRLQIAPVTSTAYNRTAAAQRAEVDAPVLDERPSVEAGGRDGPGKSLAADNVDEQVDGNAHSVREDNWSKFVAAGETDSRSATATHVVGRITDPEEFEKFLALRSWGMAETVWEKFDHLPSDVKDQYTLAVLRYVALSHRLLEPQRYLDLLSGFSPGQWTRELVDGAIRAALSLDDFRSALKFGGETLDMVALVHGFDLLLTHCLEKEQWIGLIQVWNTFKDRLAPADVRDSNELPTVVSRPELSATVAIPDLAAKLEQFWEHLRNISMRNDWETLKREYRDFIQYLFEKCMDALNPTAAAFIVKHLRDPMPYEQFIKHCVSHDEQGLAAELYESYRQLPDVKIRVPILRAMLDVYFPHNQRGMEMVLKDWYGRYEFLDYYAYRTFIRFYSRRGDVNSVWRLWKEYKEKFGGKARRDKQTVAALVHVYAVRGEVAKSRRVLEKITADGRGRQADTGTVHMNMLLNGYAKARDFQGALEQFAQICQNGKPDVYSFGTLMGMAGSRGNIQLTFGLYKLARDMGIKPDASMVDALIEAFCQNGRISDAEHLAKVTTKGRSLPEATRNLADATDYTYTVLWNTILDHYAELHDLEKVNKVLQSMKDLNVPFDGKTYEHILQALVYTKQAHHALALIKLSLQKGVFVPGPEHYTLLMSAFLKTREPAFVLLVSKMMRENNYPQTADTMTKLMEACGQWAQMDNKQRLKTPAHRYLAAALTAFRASLGAEDKAKRPDADIRTVSDQYAKMIKILVSMKDFATIPEIMSLFETQFPENNTPSTMPLKLLNALIRADFYEKNYDKVKETWNVIFNRFKAPARHPGLDTMPESISQNPKIRRELTSVAPAQRHLMNEALAVVIRAYEEEQDEEGLKNVIATVKNAGLSIGQRNWNNYVQSLVRVGNWAEACHVCETVLMPNWQGWARKRQKDRNMKNRIPLNLRRLGTSDTYMRPNTHTLLPLIKEYKQLENMAVWSSESTRLLEQINETCPRLVHAAKTMVHTGSQLEKDIFGQQLPVAREGEGDDIIDYVMKKDDIFRTEEESMEANLAATVLPEQEGWEGMTNEQFSK